MAHSNPDNNAHNNAHNNRDPFTAFPRGLGPVAAVVGLGHRGGFATLLDEDTAPVHADVDDLLIPAGIGCWNSAWIGAEKDWGQGKLS